VEKAQFVVLKGRVRLRQIACHPALINASYQDERVSGKFFEVTRNIESLLSEGHKVLIFSQFVNHLNLYKEFIENNKWKYSWLSGSTSQKNRKNVIEDFQKNKDNNIFLISLKAGGVGLNLTAAEYVFLLDPWWNPAVEAQAINRAHRIGQDKKVFAYKYITENSIEEKILKMQVRKSALSDLFIKSTNPFKSMSKNEIQNLFE
jgi:SNF2 family DNA or RNA helicase